MRHFANQQQRQECGMPRSGDTCGKESGIRWTEAEYMKETIAATCPASSLACCRDAPFQSSTLKEPRCTLTATDEKSVWSQ